MLYFVTHCLFSVSKNPVYNDIDHQPTLCMKPILQLALCLTLGSTLAQPQFLAPGAEWWYTFRGGMIQVEGWNHYYVEKDTVVDNLPCKKLLCNSYSRQISTGGSFTQNTYASFVRQQGDSVFLYKVSKWMLRWRTNPSAGATYTMPYQYWSDSYQINIKVDSIKPITIGGKPMKRIFQSGKIVLVAQPSIVLGGGRGVIISHIGPEASVNFDYTTCWNSFDCFDNHLCRYRSAEIPLHFFNSSNCDVISHSEEPGLSSSLHLIPNPCTDRIQLVLDGTIPSEIFEVSIVSQSGQLVHTQAVFLQKTLELEIQNLPPGVYYCYVRGEQAHAVERFVKTE